MELKQTIIELNHKFNIDDFDLIDNKLSKQIKIVKEKESQGKYYLFQKGEKFNSDKKYSYINYLEKSFNLTHPSIINLSGYSTQKPYLYYKYIQETSDINFLKMPNGSIQKIFIGVASGLSYLLKNGYSYLNFSINSIIFDKDFHPRLIDYINFEDQNKFDEKKLVKNYVDFVKSILSKKFAPDKNFNKHINSNLTSLLENDSTFDDFIQLLSEQPFIKKGETFNTYNIKLYTNILEKSNTIIYNDELSIKTGDKICSIEQIYFYFYKNQEMKELNKDCRFRLNFLPEYYIKPLAKIISPLSEKLNRYLFNEDISLILPNWIEIQKLTPFQIYKEIMKQMQFLEKQKRNTIFCDNKSKEISYKIESLRNHAIQFLFKASKEQPQEAEIKIEIAIQYVKGYLLEYSLEKALSTLESIPKTVNNQLVKQMKTEINSKIKEKSIKKVIQDYQDKISMEKIKKAEEEEDVLSMLYLGFAFYTGFNDYPILHSLSHYYYEKAANKSPHAMLLLGFLYFKGIIFPQNLHKAQECSQKSAQNGCIKAEIIDSLLRKHVWRSYLADFDIDEIFSNFIQPCNFDNILSFPMINYYLESNLLNGRLHELCLMDACDNLASNYVDHKIKPKYNSNHLCVSESDLRTINIKQGYSQKILLSSENFENTNDIDKQLFIAKSYFYGDNGFPVNYIESAKFFKLAADKGNSEAQWRYALLINNKIGITSDDSVEFYLKESAKQNNVKGKFYYSIYLKNIKKDMDLFEKYIKECCAADDADSMYFYGMYLEESILKKETEKEEEEEELTKKKVYIEQPKMKKNDAQDLVIDLLKQIISPKDTKKSLFDDLFGEESNADDDYNDIPKKNESIDINIINSLKHIIGYNEAASRGHFDAFLRLINLIEIQSWEEYLPIGLISDNFLSKLIEYFNKNKEYAKSNILIQIGLIKNPKLFNFYYCDHLLNEIEKEDHNDPNFNISTNLERAKKLAILAFSNNYPVKYQEKYIYIILRSLVINQEHEKALNFLLKHRDKIHIKDKEYFHLFYKRFDKSLAGENFIPACFYRKQYRYCHELFFSSSNKLSIFGKLIEYAEETKSNHKLDQNNPFAMAILGKIYKQEKKGLLRSMKKATKYFIHSAKYDCPLGQYYLGKEYYYGRYLSKNTKKAKEYLGLAIAENKEPRAGYYLYKLTKDINYLQIGVDYGHNRALLKYGRLLYNDKKTRPIAISYIRQACVQNFKKAYGFCIKHGIHFIDIKQTYSMTNQKDVKRKSGKNKRTNKNEHKRRSGLVINIPGENEINAKCNVNNNDNNNSNDDNYNINDNSNSNNNNDDEDEEIISSFSSDYWSD